MYQTMEWNLYREVQVERNRDVTSKNDEGFAMNGKINLECFVCVFLYHSSQNLHRFLRYRGMF